MRPQDLRARVLRLEELSRGLAKEEVRVRECEDPLLYVERLAYLTALRQALSGVEGARVALAKALQRIEDAAEMPPEEAGE
jgi:hypothetical protein